MQVSQSHILNLTRWRRLSDSPEAVVLEEQKVANLNDAQKAKRIQRFENQGSIMMESLDQTLEE